MPNFDPRRPPVGWPLLPTPRDGALHFPAADESVRQAIQVLLTTRRGEQLMHPRLGAGLDRFVGEPNNTTTRRRIRDAVQEALETWEPRIRVDRVDVSEVAGQPSLVRVDIGYRMRRTGAASGLGLTMQVGA